MEHEAENAGDEAILAAEFEGFKGLVESVTERARLFRKTAKRCDNPDCQTDTRADEVKLRVCPRCKVW